MSSISAIGGAGSATSIQQIIALRQQIIDRSQLLQEVRANSAASNNGPVGAMGRAEAPAGGFANALKSALEGVSATQDKAESLSAGYERGEVTDVAKVMMARQEAGVAFEATLQVRNRLLSAYQDIMRMGV